MNIDLSVLAKGASGSGLARLDAAAGAPDGRGAAATFDIEIPPFEVAACHADPRSWPGGGCRRVPCLTRYFRDLPEGGLEDKLLLLAPIRDGWAVVGRSDKYLAAVTVEAVSKDQLVVKLAESGPLTIYLAAGRPQADGLTFLDLGGGLWKADLPVQPGEVTLTIRR